MTTRRILLTVFFLSGASSLVYQVVWIRELDLVFGVTAFAAATVLSSFMAGLSLSSLGFGKLVERYRNQLGLFALLEIGICACALCLPFILRLIANIYAHVYEKTHVNFYLFSLIRFVLSFCVLIIPTSLMGGTLPVLSKFFIRRQDVLGRDISDLYSVNNFGAVLGCICAGFVLIPKIGVRETLLFAALINLVVAVTVLLINKSPMASRQEEKNEEKVSNEVERTVYPKHIIHLVLGLLGLVGFIALVYEVVWMRMLASLVLSNSVYSFTIVTATFISGLSIGAYSISRSIDRIKNPLALFAILEVLIGLSALLLLQMFKGLPFLFRNTFPGLRDTWGKSLAAECIFSFLVMIIPAILMGTIFPLISRICTTDTKNLGAKIGTIGFFDTIGSVFGPFAAGFVFIYFIGMQRSIIIMALLNLAVGAIVIVFQPAIKRKALVLLSFGCLYAVAFIFTPSNSSYWRGASLQNNKLLYYKEDASAVVTVTQKDSIDGAFKYLEVNGIDVAGTDYMLRTTQKVQAHLPLLLYEAQNGHEAARILQVGLGSGGTSWSAMLHKPREMICVELLPSVLTFAKEHFQEINHDVFDNAAYKVVIEDGRNYMLVSNDKYDVILTESIHPMFAGNANLYSKEYFELCKRRLSEDGIISIWVPLWAISLEDFKMIVNTFHSVFPNTTLWYTTNFDNNQVQLIGSKKALNISFHVWKKRIEDPEISEDLKEVRLNNPWKLLDALVMTEKDVEKFAAGAPLQTEDRPILEFSAPKSWYKDSHEVRRTNMESIMDFKKSAFRILDAGECERDTEEKLARYDDSSRHIFSGLSCYLKHDFEKSLDEFKQAGVGNPEDGTIPDLESIPTAVLEKVYSALGAEDLKTGNYDRAILAYTGLIELSRADSKAYMYRGIALLAKGDFDAAVGDLSRSIELTPGNASAYVDRGVVYAKMKMYEKAISDFTMALEIAPDYPAALKYRSIAYKGVGQEEAARKDLEAYNVLQGRVQGNNAKPDN